MRIGDLWFDVLIMELISFEMYMFVYEGVQGVSEHFRMCYWKEIFWHIWIFQKRLCYMIQALGEVGFEEIFDLFFV